MEGFFEKYKEKIEERSSVDSQGHRIWQGCSQEGTIGYGIIKAKFSDAEWHTMHVHKLLYLVHHNILSLEPGLEVSHLCHVPLCVAVEHLSLEPNNINAHRQKCFNRGKCSGHGPYRDCLLM